MSKRSSAKYKLDRRMGQNIWGRPKSPVNKREYGPGQHGQRRKQKLSDFGTQLKAKQKLKGYYANISERQFRKIYDEAARMKGDTSENLIGLLESRLDAIVYRAKFVPTPFAARQFVSHGHVRVNGKKVNIPSYRCKVGDVIEVREKSKQLGLVLEAVELAERDVPDYIEADHTKMTARYRAPAGLRRRALSGGDGAEPGGRVLFALTARTLLQVYQTPALCGGCFRLRVGHADDHAPPVHDRPRRRRRARRRASAAMPSRVEPRFRLVVTEWDLPTPRWPHAQPLGSSSLSDIHACEPWMPLERIRAIVEKANALGGDIIVLLGDFVAGLGDGSSCGGCRRRNGGRRSPSCRAPLGVHAILGNHDWWTDLDEVTDALGGGRHPALPEPRREDRRRRRRSGSPAPTAWSRIRSGTAISAARTTCPARSRRSPTMRRRS